jgi:hypothetical protein
MRYALANSFNIPAVKMLKLNGLDAMIATASAMGINSFTDPDRYGLSLTLGGGEVTMLEMAQAYGVFANSGYKINLHPILKVVDSKGKVLNEYKPVESPLLGKKVLPDGVSYIISNILSDNGARTPSFGSNSPLFLKGFNVAVKTGTTNDYRDNWTIGYTPSYVVATWVGNNDNHPLQGVVSGITGAAPIWHQIILGRKNEQVDMILGVVLAKPNQSIYDTLLIDIGINHGVKVGDKVFASGNIPIGTIREVYPSSAKVVLFSNSGEVTSVIVSGKNVSMELVGRGGGNFEMTMPRDFTLLKGDQVVLPSINNHVVAIVETIISDSRDAFQKAILVSPVNFQQLKFVQVEK